MLVKSWIETKTIAAFESLGLPSAHALVRISDRPDLCDYQCNGALAAGKILKKNPRDVAAEIKNQLDLENVDIDIVGPGFLNFRLRGPLLVKALNSLAQDKRMGVPTTENPTKIIIDYGGPNAAKPMHVGHLRSSIIGESLKRLLRFMGHEVLADIHLGDWGTQMGMLIYAIEQKQPDLPYFDKNFQGPYPSTPPLTLKDLEEIYPQISALSKEDEDVLNACRKAVFELQQGRPGYRALWQHFVDLSVQDMRKQFEKLGVHFDQWFGESRYQEGLQDLVDHFLAEKIAVHSQGAIIVPIAEPEDKTEMPPLLLQKSDGGFLYATTDLATIKERIDVFKAKRLIYVVDGRQSLHFKQVFRAAAQAGWQEKMEFLGFGTMNGPDNKPFKTRAGGVMRLSELMEMLEDAALDKINEAGVATELDDAARQKIAFQIGIATLKFADLQHDLKQNYQFSLEKFMRLEGKTGPYLQYAAVRVNSILAKAEALGIQHDNTLPTHTWEMMPEERGLILSLLRFPELCARAADLMAPHIICEAVFDLAQNFSRFYQQCSILKEADLTVKKARLTLAALTYAQLSLYLSLLGIDIPERM